MNDLQNFKFWCQKTLPLAYDDSLSYYEVLTKVVDYMNKVVADEVEIIAMIAPYGVDFVELKKELNIVNAEMEKVKNGDYVSLYLEGLSSWIDSNLQTLVARIAKFVAFELDASGHLIANIPSTWQFLVFDTDIIPDSPTYGHLILEW